MSDLVLTMGATARIDSRKVKIRDERGLSCLAADAEGLEGGCHVEGPYGWGDTGQTPPQQKAPRFSGAKGSGGGANGIPFRGAHREMPAGFQKATLGRGMNSSCPPQ